MNTNNRNTVIIRHQILKNGKQLELPESFPLKKLFPSLASGNEQKQEQHRTFNDNDSHINDYQERMDIYSQGFDLLIDAWPNTLNNNAKIKIKNYNERLLKASTELLASMSKTDDVKGLCSILDEVLKNKPDRYKTDWYKAIETLDEPLQAAYKQAVKQTISKYNSEIKTIDEEIENIENKIKSMDYSDKVDQNTLKDSQLLVKLKESLNTKKENSKNLRQQRKNELQMNLSQVALDQYLSSLTSIVSQELGLNKMQAVKLLDRAEQYAVLQNGRAGLVSVSKQGDNIVVQVEEPLQTMSKSLLDEYFAIVKPKATEQEKPYWYNSMDFSEKYLLNHILKDIAQDLKDEKLDEEKAKEKLASLFSTLPSKLRTIPGPPNLSRTHLYIFDQDGKKELLHEQRIRSSMIAPRDVLEQDAAIREFHTLENLKQIIAQQVTKQVTEMAAALDMSVEVLIDDNDFSLPILLQTLVSELVNPDKGLYQDKMHAIEVICKQLQREDYKIEVHGKVIPAHKIAIYATNHPQNYSAGIVTENGGPFLSVSGKDRPQNYNKPHANSNAEDTGLQNSVKYAGNLVENAKKIQSLMMERLNDLIKQREEKARQYQAEQLELLRINKQKDKSDKNLELKSVVENRITSAIQDEFEKRMVKPPIETHLQKNISILNDAIKKYEAMLEKGRGPERHNREMILSSFEAIITDLTYCIAHRSCVSGKDREGLLTLHTHAIWTFIQRFNKAPDMNNSDDRKSFVKIFAELFVTRHQQENAGQNAPGAVGIKTPYKYLPTDILDAIREIPGGKRILEESDRLASNNEAKHCIKTLGSVISSKAARKAIQQKYKEYKNRDLNSNSKVASKSNNNEEQQKTKADFIRLLETTLAHKQYWESTHVGVRIGDKNYFRRGEAKGIAAMRATLNDAALDDEAKFNKIVNDVNNRPKADQWRLKGVNFLYSLVSKAGHENSFQDAYAELEAYEKHVEQGEKAIDLFLSNQDNTINKVEASSFSKKEQFKEKIEKKTQAHQLVHEENSMSAFIAKNKEHLQKVDKEQVELLKYALIKKFGKTGTVEETTTERFQN